MKCERIEEKLIEILEGEKPDKEVLEHVKRCKSCKEFYNYIIELKEEIKNIEKFKPGEEFEERIISSFLKEPLYPKVFTLMVSSVLFLLIIFAPYLFKFIFLKGIIFFLKIASFCKIFSDVFKFKLCYLIPFFIFSLILVNSGILFISTFLLKKLAFREVKI